MGIIMNVLSIVTGSLFGNIFKERIKFKNFTVFGIAIIALPSGVITAGYLSEINKDED